MITITINSVDRTSEVELESVRLNQNLGKQPSEFYFAVKGTGKTIPTLGQTIIVAENGSSIFKGKITDRIDTVEGKILPRYSFICMDGFYDLDNQLVNKAYNDTDAYTVINDIVTNFTSGFTLDMAVSSPTVKTIRFNYEQISNAFQKIANAIGWDWYVDADYVIHFLPPDETEAPYTIDDTSGNLIWSSLNFTSNLTELKNKVFVRGGEYNSPISEANAVDKYEAVGLQNTFPLVYKYSDVEVTVDTVAQTVGADYLDTFDDYDCLYNFQEKLVRFPDGTLSGGEIVKVFGNAKVPIIVEASDSDSIVAYGERQSVKIDKSINSIEEAELLASSLIDQWRNGSKEGSFSTSKTGFKVGQKLTISSTKFGVSDTYKINRVKGFLKTKDEFQYDIEFIKSGQTTFADIIIDLIGKTKDNIVISTDEVIQIFRKVEDALSMTDEITETLQDSPPYHYGPVTTGNEGKYNFATYT